MLSGDVASGADPLHACGCVISSPLCLGSYLQNQSMESENGFGGRDLWRLQIQLPTLGQARVFVWVSFDYLSGYKSQHLSDIMVQGLTSLLLKNGFLTSDLNFLCCNFCP